MDRRDFLKGLALLAAAPAVAKISAVMPATEPAFRVVAYTGNGIPNGPFVWCGFKPKYAIFKWFDPRKSLDWVVEDLTRRNPSFDAYPSGLKLRSLEANANGEEYVAYLFDRPPSYAKLPPKKLA